MMDFDYWLPTVCMYAGFALVILSAMIAVLGLVWLMYVVLDAIADRHYGRQDILNAVREQAERRRMPPTLWLTELIDALDDNDCFSAMQIAKTALKKHADADMERPAK